MAAVGARNDTLLFRSMQTNVIQGGGALTKGCAVPPSDGRTRRISGGRVGRRGSGAPFGFGLVPVYSLSDFLLTHVVPRRNPPKHPDHAKKKGAVFAKIDVEGTEFALFKHLLTLPAATDAVDLFAVECKSFI